jgi:cephalosporin hydroxylase
VSDKWSLYLHVYEERLRPYRQLPVRLLEIGVQNGGSLEIHAQYFPNAGLIAGCDINIACAQLQYAEPNIRLYVGDTNAPHVRKQILSRAPFDIIIDDGSQGSSDMVNTSCNYFSALREGGL